MDSVTMVNIVRRHLAYIELYLTGYHKRELQKVMHWMACQDDLSVQAVAESMLRTHLYEYDFTLNGGKKYYIFDDEPFEVAHTCGVTPSIVDDKDAEQRQIEFKERVCSFMRLKTVRAVL